MKKCLRGRKKYLARWIALKIIDGNEKILGSIQKNLKINLQTKEVKENISQIEQILNNNGISKSEVKDKMISSIIFVAENVYKDSVEIENNKYNSRDRKIDKILTSKKFGIPIMILFLGIIFWITIVGANYPSELLSQLFGWVQEKFEYVLKICRSPVWFQSLLIDGVYKTLTWIIAVMLPPMAIFFPIFTILEDLGYLPRIAFNLDKYFRKAGSSRKTGTNHVHGIWLQ